MTIRLTMVVESATVGGVEEALKKVVKKEICGGGSIISLCSEAKSGDFGEIGESDVEPSMKHPYGLEAKIVEVK